MIEQFPATLDHLQEILKFVYRYGVEAGFQESDMYQIELAVEEALVNIIIYAFTNQLGSIQVECKTDEFKCFSIIISDQGVPYNPLNFARMLDHAGIIESKSMGGFGIFLIIKTMDEIRYRYADGKNVLTLIKYK